MSDNTIWFHGGAQVIEVSGRQWVPKTAYDSVLAQLDAASPRQDCARCGKVFRWHEMVPNEGDEWECFDCFDSENAREAKGLDHET